MQHQNSILLIKLTFPKAWISWTEWTSCTFPCGGGNRTRSRECQNLDDNFIVHPDHCSGKFEDVQLCNTIPCTEL